MNTTSTNESGIPTLPSTVPLGANSITVKYTGADEKTGVQLKAMAGESYKRPRVEEISENEAPPAPKETGKQKTPDFEFIAEAL